MLVLYWALDPLNRMKIPIEGKQKYESSRPSANSTWLLGQSNHQSSTSTTNSKTTIIIMKNLNSFLQRNLQDLESEIHIALSSPTDSNLMHSIHRKFLFLRNLLSAETASNPRRPKHSPCLEIRLAELEAVLRRWEGDCKDVSVSAAGEDHADEDCSVCSCTESSTEGPVDWDSLVDGGFERAIGEEEEEAEEEEDEDKRLLQGQVESVALGRMEDSSGTRVIQRKIRDPPPSKTVKLWKAILVSATFGVILGTVMYLECFRDLHMGDHVSEEVIPT